MKKLTLILPFLLLVACKGSDPEPEPATAPPVSVAEPTKTAIHLLIATGQSNSAGSAIDIENAPQVPQGWAFEWRGHRAEPVHLAEPTRQNSKHRGSAWSAFAIRFHELTGEKVVVINAAIGGRKVSELTPYSQDGAIAFGWIQDAVEHYRKSPDYQIKSISAVWLQGEADAAELTDLDQYFRDLEEVERGIKAIAPSAGFYVVRVGYNSAFDCDQLKRAYALGQGQIDRSPTPVSNLPVSFVNEGSMSDNVHYSQDAYNRLGVDVANNLVYYLNGTDVSYQLKSEIVPDFRCG